MVKQKEYFLQIYRQIEHIKALDFSRNFNEANCSLFAVVDARYFLLNLFTESPIEPQVISCMLPDTQPNVINKNNLELSRIGI